VGRSSGSILAVNAGSSSLKLAIHHAAGLGAMELRAAVERIGLEGASLSWRTRDGRFAQEPFPAPDRTTAVSRLIDWLEGLEVFADVRAVGHRVVHGLDRTAPALITPEVMAELRRVEPYAPEHLPREIALIEAFSARHPTLPQIACFDTVFHAAMPRVARLLPIPRRYFEKGVRRYGFHGLSFEYLVEELARVAGTAAARGKVILAHLGSGASLAAIRDGASIDTSMGFTPAAGLVMSTRTGDLDPGVAGFLARNEGLSASDFDRLVSAESGLLGVSETSSDMRDLLAAEGADQRAAEAVTLFCYQAKKWIGAFAAALGGLDTLVFSAGIGERSAPIRARICEGLGFLDLELDSARNAAHEGIISTSASGVTVRVLLTDEELMIARAVSRVLG
jgi:acetate kinase